MLKNALLEIGTEEIPARFMPEMLLDLKTKAEEKLKAGYLKFSKIETFGTCRRLTLYIEGLDSKTEDIIEEIKGPPKRFAYDENGRPSQSAIGFAKKYGLKPEDLIVKSLNKEEYVFALVKKKGIKTEDALSKIFPQIISLLYLPISMRWGNCKDVFIRPIHWILAVYGNKIVKFEFAGIKSGNISFGHRFLAGKRPIVFDLKKSIDISIYKSVLKKSGVIVDQNERKEFIKKEVKRVAKGLPLLDEDLVNEVNFLVENPVALLSEFNSDFLNLPKEVLITTMKKNQKYFPVLKGGKLQPYFVVIADGTKKEYLKHVAEGNKRVISARLYDARFFFEEDKKIPLRNRVEKLKNIAFYEKLGSMFEKKERVKTISRWIAKHLKLDENKISDIENIAELCKADLTTHMVFEFPELQGIMGREYAISSGEKKVIADGIFEHYLPRFVGDRLPESLEGTVVSLADKFDSIVGCFSVGIIPSGSQDPYMLRRQAYGIIKIILDKKLDISLEDIIEKCYRSYEPVFLEHLFKKGETSYKDFPHIKSLILDFISQRLKIILLEEGVRHDVVDASLALFNNIVDVFEKSKAISKLLGTEKLRGVVLSADRISRLAKEAKRENIIESDFVEEGEKELYYLYLKVNCLVGEAIAKRDYNQAIDELSNLTDPVDKFFDDVLVMHEDEKIRFNRLALLKSLEKMYLLVADFQKIVI